MISSPTSSAFAGSRRPSTSTRRDVYHLYYADEVGTPGSVMTYFPFPHITQGPGRASVRSAPPVFSVPEERSATGRSASRRRA